jgi:hypothetical protein
VLPGIVQVLDINAVRIFFWPMPQPDVPYLIQPLAIAVVWIAALAWARYRYREVAREWPTVSG